MTVETLEAALLLLNHRGYKKSPVYFNVYTNRKFQSAYLYKMKEIPVYDKETGKLKKLKSQGYLVSFGGDPISCYDLKFTKITRALN